MYDKADGGSGSTGGTGSVRPDSPELPPTGDPERGERQTIEIEGRDGNIVFPDSEEYNEKKKILPGKFDENQDSGSDRKQELNSVSAKREYGLPPDTPTSVKRKLNDYLLNAEHPKGESKAKWFKEALGFTQANADELEKQLVFDFKTAEQSAVTEFGVKYNQRISITGANGKVIEVNVAWIKNNDGIIRMVTAIPTKNKERNTCLRSMMLFKQNMSCHTMSAKVAWEQFLWFFKALN